MENKELLKRIAILSKELEKTDGVIAFEIVEEMNKEIETYYLERRIVGHTKKIIDLAKTPQLNTKPPEPRTINQKGINKAFTTCIVIVFITLLTLLIT